MPLGEIGAFLLVLVVVFVWGRFWFHLVEAVLHRLKLLNFSPGGASGLAPAAAGERRGRT